jgi:serine beta-lactamase-like protein LACTB, mitochondrial
MRCTTGAFALALVGFAALGAGRLRQAGVVSLVVVATIGVGWFIVDSIGWEQIGGGAVLAVERHADDYDDAIHSAGRHLEEARERLGIVGLSAAVSIDGQVVWAAATGFAELGEHPRPLTPANVFRIGSTSKALTGTLLARLVDRGVLALDTPISTYMADLPNQEWRRLTPRQLGSHTAGLPEYSENRDWWGLYQTIALQKHFTDVEESLEVFDGSSLLFEPGTKFHYTSFDVNLLSAAMQSATGTPYLQLLDREVLRPLGMRATGGDHVFDDRGQMATFYEVEDGRARRWRDVDLSQKWASGGLVATSSDLARLCGGWFDPAFLTPAIVATMWQPQRLKSGEVNEQGYAIGWRAEPESKELSGVDPTPRYHHGGVSKGAMSWLACYPEARLGVALNINSVLDDFRQFAAEEPAITRAFFVRAHGRRALADATPPDARLRR